MTLPDRPTKLSPVPWQRIFGPTTGVSTPADPPMISGVTGDSRTVKPGDLYCGLPGANHHGAQFAAQAVAAGARGILTDAQGADIAASAGVQVPVAVVSNPREMTAHAAAACYHHPLSKLTSIGVTGTNGKTTTTFLIDAALRAAGYTTGMVGTVETRVAEHAIGSVRTTPEAWDLHALFAVMVEHQVTHVSLEISSHALAQHRVGAVQVDVAGFTNLSQDHLDFHRTMAEYFDTKAQLFTPERAHQAVVWGNQSWAQKLLAHSSVPTDQVCLAGTAQAARWEVSDIVEDAIGSTFRLTDTTARGVKPLVRVGLPGAFNVANAALAVVLMHSAGVSIDAAAVGISACTGVPGRMERISADVADAPLALVDYAHTPDAVAAACAAVRPLTRGKLIVVIGAGGGRDEDKREPMGKAAAEYADHVIVTDDNPRNEDPAAIREQVLQGAGQSSSAAQLHHVPDRSAAIAEAVDLLSGTHDTLLVAGKGHEQGQEIAGMKHPFDDRVATAAALRESGFEVSEAYR